MKRGAIHQIVPTLRPGDAVSDNVAVLQHLWRSWGHESLVFAESVAPGSAADAQPPSRLARRVGASDILVYHHSTGSDSVALFANLPAAAKVLIYHNVTPPAFLTSAPALAARSHRGIEQLSELAPVCSLAIADSEYNRADLERAGFEATAVAPLVLSDARIALLRGAAVTPETRWRSGDASPGFLHVGRVVPHKRIELAIEAVALYRNAFGPAHLRVVGDAGEAPAYATGLAGMSSRLPGGTVEFAGQRLHEELAGEYGRADVYMCPSLHEGFCVPLVECMVAGVPVIASANGAIPETLDGCGLIIDEDDPALYAEAAHTLLENTALRRRLVAAQRRRAEAFTEKQLASRLRVLFTQL